MCNRLMAMDYGIIALTSEESEFNIDFDNDGNYRWSYGIDSTLIDFANIRAIRDAMIQLGKMDTYTPNIALGFSAGGAFTEFVSAVLHWRAAVNHNTSGNDLLAQKSTIPYFHCISENDNHPEVGPAGNAEARVHYQAYLDRDVCIEFKEFYQMPLYKERFDRSPYISEQQSIDIFNEIKTNNGMDENNVLKGLYNQLESSVLAAPNKFPIITALTGPQKNHLKDQIETTNAEHHFKADFNGRTIQFIETVCDQVTAVNETNATSATKLTISPNPASNFIEIHGATQYNIYTLNGTLVFSGNQLSIDISEFKPGMYIVKGAKGNAKFVKL